MSRFDRKCDVADCTAPVWARELCRKHYMRWHQHGDPTTVLRPVSEWGAPSAFLAAIPADGEGCLRWPFATNGVGYAQINITGRKYLVTRLVCERFHGAPSTPSLVAAHSCGKGHEACVAPWHLSWKTQAGNMADAAAHGTLVRGERQPNAKLVESQVREIRSLRGSMSQGKIARRYGISQTMVSRIFLRKAWAHLAAETPSPADTCTTRAAEIGAGR